MPAKIKSVLWSQTELIEFGKENPKRTNICRDEDGFLHIHTAEMYGKKISRIEIHRADNQKTLYVYEKGYNLKDILIGGNCLYFPVFMSMIYGQLSIADIANNLSINIYALVVPYDQHITPVKSEIIALQFTNTTGRQPSISTIQGRCVVQVGQASDDTKNQHNKNLEGYIYNRQGEFIEHIGKSEQCYVAKNYTKQKDTYQYKEPLIDLKINHDDFTYIAGVVMAECSTNNENELKCIAFTSHNYSISKKITWKATLASSYSSVPNKQKLVDTNSTKQNFTRKGVMSVLLKEKDITNGAEFWDGTDFLVWGDSERNPYNNIGSNKFDEYKFVEIPKEVYDEYLSAHKSATYAFKDSHNHPDESKDSTQTHSHQKKDNKIIYNVPAQEFTNAQYRTCNGDFYYDQNSIGKAQLYGLSATIAAGQSIFWKKTKNRLTQGTVGICQNKNCKTHYPQ